MRWTIEEFAQAYCTRVLTEGRGCVCQPCLLHEDLRTNVSMILYDGDTLKQQGIQVVSCLLYCLVNGWLEGISGLYTCSSRLNTPYLQQ